MEEEEKTSDPSIHKKEVLTLRANSLLEIFYLSAFRPFVLARRLSVKSFASRRVGSGTLSLQLGLQQLGQVRPIADQEGVLTERDNKVKTSTSEHLQPAFHWQVSAWQREGRPARSTRL